jgi:RimJ/RimL family protein N-acetyltransferase
MVRHLPFCLASRERPCMSVILKTPRLILRTPQVEDVARLVELIGDFDVSKNLSRVPHPYSAEDGQKFVATLQEPPLKPDYVFSILRTADNIVIGMCGVHPERGWEIGYWLGKAYWGTGYATEAVTSLVAFGFEELGAERLAAEWFHDNAASGRVLEKLGFIPRGETMSNCAARGHRVAAHVVALDRDAYKTRKNAS